MYAFLRVCLLWGFVLNSDGSMGFPLSTHCCSDCTPCAGPLQGELCTAPLPTHWQLPHPVFARLFDAQLRRTPSNCIGVFFLLFVVA